MVRSLVPPLTLVIATHNLGQARLVALAISVGETAPLLYTAGFSPQAPNFHLTHSAVGHLLRRCGFYNYPSPKVQDLSYDAALILVVLVLLLIVARLVVSRTQRHTEKN